MRILTARDALGVQDGDGLLRWILARRTVTLRLLQYGVAEDAIPGPATVDAIAPPATAYINQGRWLADCPTAGCGGSMMLLPGTPYLCATCLNVEIGHRWRRIAWPKSRTEIERVLSLRLLPEQANWWPSESVDALRAENAAHGLEAS